MITSWALVPVAFILASHQESVSGVDLVRLGDGVYAAVRHEPIGLANQSNSLIVVGDSAVLVVDAQFTRAGTLETLAAVRRVTRLPVRYVVNTHWHDDHVAGNQVYADTFPGVRVIMHEHTRADLASLGAPNRQNTVAAAPPLVAKYDAQLARGLGIDSTPVRAGEQASMASAIAIMRTYLAEQPAFRETTDGITVRDSLRLTLGGQVVDIRWFGRANTRGDLVVYVPRARVVATGDLVVAPIPFAFASYPAEWVAVLDSVAALRPAMLLPGHGPVMHDLSYMKKVRAALSDMRDSAAAIVQRGDSVPPTIRRMRFDEHRAALTAGDPWLDVLFDRFFRGPALAAAVQRERERRAGTP